MIHIRRYDMGQLGRVLEMAEAFHSESPVYRDKPFSRAKVATMLDNAVDAPNVLPIISEDEDGTLTGFALVMVEAHFFCDVKYLADFAIYVTPDRRGHRSFPRLMAYIEAWAREQGALEGQFGITTGINHDQAVRSFMKLGYAPAGTLMAKVLA